jgi:hypothetical protein
MSDFRIEAAAEPGTVANCLQAWARVADDPDVTFVLPKERLHPSALVLLGAMAAGRRLRGLSNRTAGEVAANPLARFVLRHGTSGIQRTTDHGLLESLQPVFDLRAARRLADAVSDALSSVVPPPSPSLVRMARFVFEELGANVVQHSGRPETGYGLADIDPAQQRLELAFADAGMGFRASLQRNPELEGRVADDAEALQLAVTPRITGTTAPRTNMGIGLKALTDFSDLTGGDLWIVSGSALLHRHTTAGQRTNVLRAVPPWQGSWICVTAPVG